MKALLQSRRGVAVVPLGDINPMVRGKGYGKRRCEDGQIVVVPMPDGDMAIVPWEARDLIDGEWEEVAEWFWYGMTMGISVEWTDEGAVRMTLCSGIDLRNRMGVQTPANRLGYARDDSMIRGYNGTCISEETSKMGNMLSVSLLPGWTCRKDAPCRGKGGNCYAERLCRLRKAVAATYAENTEMVMAGRYDEMASDIEEAIAFKHATHFRWFVGGDIPDPVFLTMMIRIAEETAGTTFLAFTKRYGFVEDAAGRIPGNLRIVLSAWKELQPTPGQRALFPVCYYDDGTPECLVPPEAKVCGGNCEKCLLCFRMGPGDSVAIRKHRGRDPGETLSSIYYNKPNGLL